MPFPFPRLEAAPVEGRVERPEIGFSQFMRAAVEIGGNESIMAALARQEEYSRAATGRLISAEEANDLYGMDGLNFEGPIFENQAQLLRQRKTAERERQRLFQAGATSGSRYAAGFAGTMLGSIANPLDIGIGFVPVVGQAGKAEVAATGFRGMAASMVARRGLIPFEAVSKIPIAGRFPNTASAVIEGVVGQAVAEIPVAIANFQDKSDYTYADAAISIVGAGVLSGGLRAALSGAARMVRKMQERSHLQAQELATAQLIEGRNPVDVSSVIEADPNVIAYKMRVADMLSKHEDIEMSRGYLTRQAMEEIDARTRQIRREQIEADPAREVNRDDLIAIAYAELKAAVDSGEQLAPDIALLQRTLYDFEKARTKATKAKALKQKGIPEKVKANKEIARQKLDELAEIFGLRFNEETKNRPASFESLDQRRFNYSVAEKLDPQFRGDFVAANARRAFEMSGDSELNKRVALEKLRRTQQEAETIDRRLRQEAELEVQIRQASEMRPPTENEKKFLNIDEGAEMEAKIAEDVEELLPISRLENFERTDISEVEQALEIAGACVRI